MSDTPTIARPGAAPKPSETPPDEILLGRYRVLERRGTGGFGTVCTCWDTRLQRRVAIKRMPLLAQNGTTTAEEALAEARTACMLAHPNIATVFDFEADGSYAYLVMEYVDGLNLAELLARVEGGRLTYEECAHVLQSVTRALSFAHENRVLHLDIKPTNIMIDRQGVVKLADFGMAALASAAGYGGARGGTVGYMPPEQIEGLLVDERADVFSLAVVVWQSLTGSDPFLAPNAAASRDKIKRGPARSLSKDCPELAGEPERALLSALAPVTSKRTTSVRQLAGELLPFLGHAEDGAASLSSLVRQSEQDEPAERTSWEARHLPLSMRHPWLAGATVRALTSLLVLLTARPLLAVLSGDSTQIMVGGLLVVSGVSALWPPLGSILVGVLLCAAFLLTAPTAASLLLAALSALALRGWWVFAGRRDHLASAAVLLPCCLSSPLAGAGLAGFALDPAPAALTGVVGYLAGSLFHLASAAGFAASPTVTALLASWERPSFWLLAVGAAACAAVSSAVALRGSVAAGVAGQSLGLTCIIVFEVLAARMENSGIWMPPDGESVALAVILFVFLFIATVLRGPLFEEREGEDINELPQ